MLKTKAKKSATTGIESRLLFATVKVSTLLKDNPGIHNCLFVVDRQLAAVQLFYSKKIRVKASMSSSFHTFN